MKTITLLIALVVLIASQAAYSATPPKIGDAAPNFKLETLDGKSIELKQLVTNQPVVLVVLRGWPGYQCGICTRQVHDFVKHAKEFSAQPAQVVMVYPGPSEELKAHAREFLQDKNWPKEFLFVIDPDYTFTGKYGLRWDAKNERRIPPHSSSTKMAK